MRRLHPAWLTVMNTLACNSVLLGGAPPTPAPPDVPTGRESLRNGASSTVFVAQRTKDDIELRARDLAAAEDGMARRCPDGYVVSFVGSAPSETCSAPRGLYSSRRTGQQYAGPTSREDEAPRSFPRCRAQDDVLVRYRCSVQRSGGEQLLLSVHEQRRSDAVRRLTSKSVPTRPSSTRLRHLVPDEPRQLRAARVEREHDLQRAAPPPRTSVT